jgi:hypothetical protein
MLTQSLNLITNSRDIDPQEALPLVADKWTLLWLRLIIEQ